MSEATMGGAFAKAMSGKKDEIIKALLNVGEAAGRVADGLTGDNPGKYLTDTLAGKR